ncbi:hypothetical protein M3Y97_00973400 [Aphelenchoides bicaudatus]|nr:hypothetical protein M3Y97_00973400 [Aphelenchoides bicaudatus]
MSNERKDRRTSILKKVEDWSDMNRTKGGGDRRVSFHNKKTVQRFDAEHSQFQHEPKTEHFSLSSISSADEATRHSSLHKQDRPPLATINNAADQKPETRRPLGDMKKARQSMGADDTRVMFAKGNDQANLTLQFGERPPIEDTFTDDNTQALFAPAQQTCTEAFFEQIHENGEEPIIANNVNNVRSNQLQNLTMNNDVTEDFLDIIASQARPQEPVVQSSEQPPHNYTYSEYEMRLENTAPRHNVPKRDDTFQPEISSYVLHENSDGKEGCKSIFEDRQFIPSVFSQQPTLQPSFTFSNMTKEPTKELINFERNDSPLLEPSVFVQTNTILEPIDLEPSIQLQDNSFQMQEDVVVENISPNALLEENELIEMSQQITLYDEEGFELREEAKKTNAQSETLPVILTQSIFFEQSNILIGTETNQLSDQLSDQLCDQLCDKFNQTIEMADEIEQDQIRQDHSISNQLYQTYAVPEQSPNLTYVVPTPVVKSKHNSQESVTLLSIIDESKISEGSESLHKKLNETREKLVDLENKVANRRSSANFKQILADAKLNRSMAHSPMAISPAKKPESSNCPPLKQARVSNLPTDTPRSQKANSVAIPTAHQQTPQPSMRKVQQVKLPNPLQALTSNRKAQSEANRMLTPSPSALRAVYNTPVLLAPTREFAEINPLHGPVQLKSVEYIKWAHELEFDPNWLDAERLPKWNPLSDDHLDLHGPTAGKEKSELKRKAETIVVRTINKFNGKMYRVRKYLWDLGQEHNKSVQPYKNKMWELNAKYDELVNHYNSRIAVYNKLIQKVDAKKHAEVEKFIDDMRNEVRSLIDEWTSDN